MKQLEVNIQEEKVFVSTDSKTITELNYPVQFILAHEQHTARGPEQAHHLYKRLKRDLIRVKSIK